MKQALIASIAADRLTWLASVCAAALALGIAAPAAADTLVDNVQGVTIDEEGKIDRFTGLWIDDDGKVKLVLKRGDRRPSGVDYLLDGKGQYLVPGMIDAHAHVLGIGFAALTLDLSGTASLAEAQAKIAAYAAENPGRRWIVGTGWNQEKWGLGRFPTAAELDAVVSDRPVWLERVDGHAGWANSAAIALSGANAASKDPVGGRIERTSGSREPSGIFVDEAMGLVASKIPRPRPEDRDLALQEAQNIMLRSGVTAVADMGTTIEDWQSFRRAGDKGSLKMRIMSYAAGVEAMELIGGPGPSPWLYDDKLRLNGVKLYLDGALGSRGAWLKQPYADDAGNVGLPSMNSSQLRNLMSRAALDKFQVAIHAIGDAANSEVLGAIEDMSGTYQGDRRWRIEHAQVVDPAELALFGRHGIIASMQPVHQTSDRTMAEARLGQGRLAGAYAWNSIADTGARLAFGSDAPVESVDPFAGLATAFTRTDAAGQPFGGWQPQERVNREQALAAFTYGGAYAGFAEGRFGRLVEGERADFLLVDRDLLLSSPEEIRSLKVLQTWVGGERVYDSAGGERGN
ncbi:amidohydrolase [Allopontixanthobacter sp.]|uniref:amidohydrolase n=1 Tax=Allopontixanthobacter sp. TaxID=2906452 RepID=UPI002ABBE1B0|nr:amidohydrolase family protein [Allopontixanthobacter sp.]MDZ4306427.1 amidohydrolase family protein [Allopontixanthobacter sp.]